MKSLISASLALAFLTVAQPSFANNDSDQGSELSAVSALAAIAVPVAAVGAAGYSVAETGTQLVKVVDASGKAIGELTVDVLDDACKDLDDSDAPHATAHKKEIPLVVRKDYVEMNEKVNTDTGN
jgi:hypothetical protein